MYIPSIIGVVEISIALAAHPIISTMYKMIEWIIMLYDSLE
jgi:hypothetical protein